MGIKYIEALGKLCGAYDYTSEPSNRESITILAEPPDQVCMDVKTYLNSDKYFCEESWKFTNKMVIFVYEFYVFTFS